MIEGSARREREDRSYNCRVMPPVTLAQLGQALREAGWNVRVEVEVLVRLARSQDAVVAMRAMNSLARIAREAIDPGVQRQIRERLARERATSPKRTVHHDGIDTKDSGE